MLEIKGRILLDDFIFGFYFSYGVIKNFMRNFFKIGFPVAALLFVFGVFSVSQTNAQGPMNTIMNKMDAHYKALDVLRSNVTMSKYNPQIKRSEVSEGNVTYLPEKGKRKMYVRLNWVKPTEEYLTVVNGQYNLYKRSINQVYTGKVSSAQNKAQVSGPLTFLSMSKKQLNDNYKAQFIGNEKVNGTTDASHIKLTPKTASNYKQVELWVDSDGMPVQATVVEKSDDATTISLYDIQKNIDVDYNIFKLQLPNGVKVIKG